MKKKMLPPSYFMLHFILIFILHFLLPQKRLVPFPYNYLGIVLIIFGSWLNLWTDNLFKVKKQQ